MALESTVTHEGLARLEAAVRRDLDILDYPCRGWMTPRTASDGSRIYDALIIGGGQGGLAVAFGLMREKVTNILVIDQNAERFEGPWRTFARMHTLRTPKHVTGPDHNLPNLTVRAWYEAQYGEESWREPGLLPKEMWADYLHWYRKTLNIPVQNDTVAGAIEWHAGENCYRVPVTSPDGFKTLLARKVVLATGIDGSGRWAVPDIVRENLSPSLYAHTRDDIDFEALKGKKIGVLGAGASAFDNASVAMETGAAEVHLFFRREELPNINPYRWAENTGFLKHHADLPDAERWRFILQILRMGQLPPTDTFERATRNPHFHFQPGSPWLKVEEKDGKARVTTPKEVFDFDFLIIGTGFVTDLTLRPELEKVCPHIALWSDRYTPPPEERHADLSRHPYLGPNFEFTEKTPGEAPWLSGIFNYTFGGLASLGFGGGSISGMKYSLPKIIYGITRQLYVEDRHQHFESLCAFDLEEF